ncbi:MAG: hypothetical protein IT460_15975 [Planctomycetes bacterium]|nr:hypothetical protein [Planctomycetota bacterium]
MTTCPRHARTSILAAVALAACALGLLAAPARAQDAPPDPAALLRDARSAESVERDGKKAIGLYRRVLELAPQTDAARDAALRLLAIHEARGERAEALEAVRALADLAARLDDGARHSVHEAAVRLLRASGGGEVRTPVGTLVVVVERTAGSADAATPAASPLDAKILPLLAVAESRVGTNLAASSLASTSAALATIGTDALPLLERELRAGDLARARLVASILTKAFGPAAVPTLERVVRDGDAVARGAAWSAFAALPASDAKRSSIRRLLEVPEAAALSPSVVDLATLELPEATLLPLARAEPDGGPLLASLLARGSPEAFDRLLARAKTDADGAWALLLRVATRSRLDPERLRPEQVEALTTFVTSRGSGPDADRVPAMLGALSMARWKAALPTDPAERGRAAESAWRRYVELPADQRGPYVAALAEAGIAVPAALFRDPAWTRAFFDAYPALAAVSLDPPLDERVRREDPALWTGVLEAALRWDRSTLEGCVSQLLAWAAGPEAASPTVPGTTTDARWVELASRDGLASSLGDREHLVVLDAAARSGAPAFATLVRRWLDRDRALALPDEGQRGTGAYALRLAAWGRAIAAYAAPDRLELWADVQQRRGDVSAVFVAFDRALREAPTEAALDAVRRWRSGRARAAVAVVGSLADRRDRESVARLAAEETAAPRPSDPAYRSALISACDVLKLREAWPFLLHELDGDARDEAAACMENIHRHEDERARFEAWGRAAASASSDLSDLLADADPEIRRGAVLTLAATEGRSALPALLRLAKAEKDPAVRAVALDAVDRLARTPDRPDGDGAAPTAPAGTPAAPGK